MVGPQAAADRWRAQRRFWELTTAGPACRSAHVLSVQMREGTASQIFELGAAGIALHTDNASTVLAAVDALAFGPVCRATAIDIALALAHILFWLHVASAPRPVVRVSRTERSEF